MVAEFGEGILGPRVIPVQSHGHGISGHADPNLIVFLYIVQETNEGNNMILQALFR